MKLSEWIKDLQGWLQDRGDCELSDTGVTWLADAIPDEMARWLLETRWVELTMLPEGVIVPGVLDQDPKNGDEMRLGWRIEDLAARLRTEWNADERAQLAAALRRALAELEA